MFENWVSRRNNSKKTRSIRYSLILSNSVLLSLLVLMIVTANLIIVTNLLMKNISYYAQQTITQTNDKIDVTLQRIELTSRMVVFNAANQKIILLQKNSGKNEMNGTLWDEYQRKEKLNGIFNDMVMAIPEIYSVAIYFNKNNYYGFNYFGNYIGNEVSNQNTYDKGPIERKFIQLDDINRNILWISTYDTNYKVPLFTMIRSIVDIKSFNRLGILVLSIESKFINDILSEGQLGKSGKLYFLNQEGVIIGSNVDNVIGKKLQYHFNVGMLNHSEGTFFTRLYGKPSLIAYKTSPETGLRLVGITPLGELNSEILKSQSVLIGIGILGLVISIMLSIILASLITKPINNLRKAMKEVEKGQLVVDITDNSFIETKELSKGFSVMLQKLQLLLTKVYEEELRKKEAEFKALQAQINPHFLYNTLETINYMLIIEGKNNISKLVTALGDILRYNLRKGNDLIFLSEDMEQIENYLLIQKARFGDRLRYEMRLEPETADCRILKLLIQPLVENAINHGIERKRGEGILRIGSQIQGNKLMIRVADNGVGMTEEELRRLIIDDSADEVNNKHTKLGVNNVNRRIKMYYGEQYGLEIQSEKNEGTTINIFLPVIKEGNGA